MQRLRYGVHNCKRIAIRGWIVELSVFRPRLLDPYCGLETTISGIRPEGGFESLGYIDTLFVGGLNRETAA